ncbi:hypothetical protein [Dyella psychrodurans]|uniref:hypothetical protein n=1 Tax=Dyella psychrodurans TaxID=1927960 RepID=UPI0011C070DD|nr:hypothetical protein [Dyella psychrodurans]
MAEEIGASFGHAWEPFVSVVHEAKTASDQHVTEDVIVVLDLAQSVRLDVRALVIGELHGIEGRKRVRGHGPQGGARVNRCIAWLGLLRRIRLFRVRQEVLGALLPVLIAPGQHPVSVANRQSTKERNTYE